MQASLFPVLGSCNFHFSKPTLIIGNKNYSTWSLRAWLMFHGFGIAFDEMPIKLFHASNTQILQTYAPLGKVPVLLHGNQTIWDSLAIALYASMYLTNTNVWGNNPALAMSLISEMHAGFNGLRMEMPMNIRAKRKIIPSAACLADLQRFELIVQTCYQRNGQNRGYLLGEFSIIDVFYAPIIFRLNTYAEHSGINLATSTVSYMNTILSHESIKVWRQQAMLESDYVVEDEAGEKLDSLAPSKGMSTVLRLQYR